MPLNNCTWPIHYHCNYARQFGARGCRAPTAMHTTTILSLQSLISSLVYTTRNGSNSTKVEYYAIVICIAMLFVSFLQFNILHTRRWRRALLANLLGLFSLSPSLPRPCPPTPGPPWPELPRPRQLVMLAINVPKSNVIHIHQESMRSIQEAFKWDRTRGISIQKLINVKT